MRAVRFAAKNFANPTKLQSFHSNLLKIVYSLNTCAMRSAFSVSSSSTSNGSAPKFTPAPHSGYHRRGNVNPNRNKSQSFFEGWYFRLSISREQSVSLIYHVYDPDDEISKRHSAGAQIIGPNGEYIYKESRKVRENFMAEAHELALQLEFDTAVKKPKLDTNRREFYRVSDRGTVSYTHLTLPTILLV